MASTSTHLRKTGKNGFCLCHLLCVWRVAGRLCLYLGYFHVSYVPQRSQFVLDDQLYVHLMGVANLLLSLAYLWFSQRWIYDQLLLLLYVPLYVYFLQLRQHLTRLLNECSGIHRALQRALGSWMCVSLLKGSILSLLLLLELLLLLVWQFRMYFGYQFCFVAGLAFIYHMHLVFLGNYLIWLGSIYRALNEFLVQHMNSSRVGILKSILRQESIVWHVHWRVTRYFVLHLLSFLALILVHIRYLFLGKVCSDQVIIDQLQLVHLVLLLLSLLITLLVTAHELQQQRGRFHKNFLRLEDHLEYFQPKSWCLLKNQTLPMPFGLPILRSYVKPQPKRDIITMLFSSNLPALQLRQSALPLVSLGLGPHQLQLSLFQLLTTLIQLGCMLVLPLCLHLNSHLHVQFYTPHSTSDFDANVSSTISQVYRYYNYDELD